MPYEASALLPTRTDPASPVPSQWRWYVVGGIVIAAGIAVRVFLYPTITSDYTYFIKVWFDTLATHPGLTAFAQPFADYAPLYLYFLKVLTYIGTPSLDSVKTLSVLFDALNAFAAYRILAFVPTLKVHKGVRFVAASVLFILPTVIMNGALWGQSDAVYAAGVLFSLWAMLADAPLLAAVSFGFAVSIKLQAIFFAPVLAGYLLRGRKTASYVLVPPALFTLSIAPAWLSGGNFWSWFTIYGKQAGEYPYLSVSAQSIFAFVQPLGLSAHATNTLFWLGLVFSGVLALAFVWIAARSRILSAQALLILSLMSVLLLPYFLPRMHERYFYLADVISTLYAFFVPRRAFIPVLVVLASTLAYFPYLSSQVSYLTGLHLDLRIPAALLLLPVALMLFDLYGLLRTEPLRISATWGSFSTSIKKLVL